MVEERTRCARVLIVDDEPKTLSISKDILALDGYEIETARDARQALEVFERAPFDAIVTDIRMPGMGGIDLLERIRERDQEVPVVILTGYATLETATRAVARGAFDYLFKPIDFEKLRATLRRAVERFRLVQENRRLLKELEAANAELARMNRDLQAEVAERTRELAIERDLLARIHAAVPAALAVLDAGGEILRANQSWEALSASEAALRRAISGDVAAIARGAAAPIRHRQVQVPARDPARGERALDISILPLTAARALVVIDDLTERVRLEEELLQAEKLSSLGILASGIVHDLSNPLTAILGTAQVLQAEVKGEHEADIQAIVNSAIYMREVCLGLTEFARRSRTGAPLAVDPSELAEKALAIARYAKKLVDVTIVRRFETGAPPVRATPNELLQVLVNLIVNAADAAPHGTIEVATARVGAERVAISVKDNGPGVPEAVRERLFEPFYTTKEPGKGTGLGLYICRRIVTRLQGAIRLETGPGGTTFTVELPAVRES
jgi:signal transduction histidine kinase